MPAKFPRMQRIRRERLIRLLSFMGDICNVYGTWSLIEAILGHDVAMSMGARRARHWCERTINFAERNGLIYRLPTRVASSVPASLVNKDGGRARRIDKEIAWAVSELGMEYLEGLKRVSACDSVHPRPMHRRKNSGVEKGATNGNQDQDQQGRQAGQD